MHEGSGISTDLKILEDLAGLNEDEARTPREGLNLCPGAEVEWRCVMSLCAEARTWPSVKSAGSRCSSRGTRAGFVLTQYTWLFPRR